MVTYQPSLEDKARHRAAWISAIASILIFGLKVSAYKITGSASVLSDALESVVNVIASIVALAVVRFAAQPADKGHPYGHGKAESFSSAFEGGLIFFAAVIIIFESTKALLDHKPPQELEVGLMIVGLAAVLNLILGLYLKSVGKKHHSPALKASGLHVLSDVWTTVGVMSGLFLVILTDIQWLDPAIAIAVGLQLAFSGYKIVRESLGVLMDETDVEVLDCLAKSLDQNRMPGVIDIHHLRMIRSGRFHHVDAHFVVPEFWDISKVHVLEKNYEVEVVRDYDFDGELAFHIDPCKKSYCRVCELKDCPVRQEPFQGLRPFTVKSLTEGPQPTNQGGYESDTNASKKN